MNGDVQSNGFTKEVSSKGHSSKTEEDTENIKDPKYSLFNASDVVLEWKPSMNPIGPGLANLGNTCFMNSVLQCLTYCPPLVNYLLFNDNPHSKQMCLNFCMACMLSKHIKQCHSRKMHQTVSPDDISRRRKSISKNFTYGSQEDAHEFLRQVLDLMCRNTVTAFENRRGFKLDSASKETTAFNRIFGGYLRSQVTCRFCKHKSNTYDHIMDFMLEVKGVDTLYEAFDKFTKTETLSNENAYECPKCKKKVPVTKKFTIHRPPNVATIQLKRFQFSSFSSFGSGKIDRHIKFPETLDLQDYLSDRSSQTALYSLSAVLVHQGFTCNSGHYYAFVKHSSGSWYLMNDHLVKQVNLGYVLNEKAYILFYTRRRNSASPRKSISSITSSAVSSTTPQIGPKVITDKLTNGSSTMIGPQLHNGALLSSSVTSLDSNGSSSSTPAKTSILKASTVTYSNHTPKIIPDSSSILKTSTSKIMSNKPNNNASVTQTKTTESNSNSIKTTLDRPTIPSFKIVPRSQIILQKALATQEKKNANGLSNGSLVNGNHKILDKDSTPRKIVGYDDSSDSEEEEVFPHKQSKIGGRHLMGVGMFLNQQPKLSDPSKSHEVFLPMTPEKSSDDFRLFSSSPLSEKKVRENPRKDQSNSSNSVQDSTINSKENGKKSNEPKEVPPTEPVNSAGNSSPNRAVETTKSITESSLPINIHEKKKHQDNGLPSKLQEKKNDFVNQLTKSMYSKDSGRKSNANNAPLNASSADSSRTGMTMDSTTEQSLTSLGKNGEFLVNVPFAIQTNRCLPLYFSDNMGW